MTRRKLKSLKPTLYTVVLTKAFKKVTSCCFQWNNFHRKTLKIVLKHVNQARA